MNLKTLHIVHIIEQKHLKKYKNFENNSIMVFLFSSNYKSLIFLKL